MSSAEIIERERRVALPAALTAFLAVALFVASLILLGTKFSADGNAELLRKIDKDSGTLVLTYVIRAIGAALLSLPLLYLFQAALARSERMRGQFVGLVIAGPLFLAGFAVFTGLSLHDAAPDFVARHVTGSADHMDDVAQNMIDDASLRDVAAGFGFGGALGFAFAMAYTCLHATRVGLLTRFWGSLGVALGVASIIFFQYTLLWIVYLGLLIMGWLPRGRPPAWAAGEAIPWPPPGERAEGSPAAGDAAEGPANRDAERAAGEEPAEEAGGAAAGPPRQRGERRKRKRRR